MIFFWYWSISTVAQLALHISVSDSDFCRALPAGSAASAHGPLKIPPKKFQIQS